MTPALKRSLETVSRQVDRLLDRLLCSKRVEPAALRRAMRYSLFAGGKRLRPFLVACAARCCSGQPKKVLKVAAALEMIHTYSLIHDDLPAMDDDDLRRGKPTSHKVFGEALAILAGDGLLTYAFETAAANARQCGLSGAATAELIRVIAAGAGTAGMVAGQVEDLAAEKWTSRKSRSQAARLLESIHRRKTAALIVAGLDAGAVLAGGSSSQRSALRAYGRAIGLAFQIADDILDVVGDKKLLGKKGSDSRNRKLTYVSLHGLERAQAKARALADAAHRHLRPFGPRARVLHDLADYIVTRDR